MEETPENGSLSKTLATAQLVLAEAVQEGPKLHHHQGRPCFSATTVQGAEDVQGQVNGVHPEGFAFKRR